MVRKDKGSEQSGPYRDHAPPKPDPVLLRLEIIQKNVELIKGIAVVIIVVIVGSRLFS